MTASLQSHSRLFLLRGLDHYTSNRNDYIEMKDDDPIWWQGSSVRLNSSPLSNRAGRKWNKIERIHLCHTDMIIRWNLQHFLNLLYHFASQNHINPTAKARNAVEVKHFCTWTLGRSCKGNHSHIQWLHSFIRSFIHNHTISYSFIAIRNARNFITEAFRKYYYMWNDDGRRWFNISWIMPGIH